VDIYQREIERKFVIQGISYELAYETLSCISRVNLSTTRSFDLYWPSSKVDFVRLRDNSQEITVKVTDKGNILDRVEENVRVDRDSMPAAKRLFTLLLGEPMNITKRFSVFERQVAPAPGTDFRVILCLYEVEGDPLKRLFFEIEAESLKVVDYMLELVEPLFDLKPINKSLYDLFSKAKSK
jgi:hypothetical protein